MECVFPVIQVYLSEYRARSKKRCFKKENTGKMTTPEIRDTFCSVVTLFLLRKGNADPELVSGLFYGIRKGKT